VDPKFGFSLQIFFATCNITHILSSIFNIFTHTLSPFVPGQTHGGRHPLQAAADSTSPGSWEKKYNSAEKRRRKGKARISRK
jgi:hypothetical protein